jgi:hypothetical protein
MIEEYFNIIKYWNVLIINKVSFGNLPLMYTFTNLSKPEDLSPWYNNVAIIVAEISTASETTITFYQWCVCHIVTMVTSSSHSLTYSIYGQKDMFRHNELAAAARAPLS